MTLKIKHLIQPRMSSAKTQAIAVFILSVVLSFSALLKSFEAVAIEVTDLYRSQVPIESQSTSDRSKALVKAMEAVLIKVGGHRQVLNNSDVKKALRKVSSYLTQYQYTRRQNQLYLQADFDEQKVNALFKSAQLPLWGSHRPLIMLWLIEEQGIERSVYNDDEQSVKTIQIKDHAQLRGLPVILPLMDLEDSLAVSNAEIWGRFPEPVRNASRRYLAEASVVMRISDNTLKPKLTDTETESETKAKATVLEAGGLNASNDDHPVDLLFTQPYRDYINPEKNQVIDCQPLCVAHDYVLDWTLVSTDRYIGKQYSGNVKNLLIMQALNDITETIYQNYAFNVKVDDSELTIEVANVQSMSVYLELVEFFNSLSSVERVHLHSVDGDSMRFKLGLVSDRQSVLKAIKIDNRLNEISDPLAPVTELSVPVFQWNQP